MCFAAANGQCTLRARLVDTDGRVVSGAHIAVTGTPLQTFSNVYGRFLLRDLPQANLTLEISLVGYHHARAVIEFPRDSLEQTIVLHPEVYQLQGVDVTATQTAATDQHDAYELTSLPPREVQSKAGGAEDVLRSLQSYPGVSSPTDFSTQLIIRGSSADENLIVMDGIEIFNPYRLYGVVSMFNPQTVERVDIMTGGFPAKYSDRLSAVLDVTNRDGSMSLGPFQARANLSLTNMNIVAEGAFLLETREDDTARTDLYYTEDAPPWNGSWLASTRRTYYDLVAGPIVKSAGLASGNVVLPSFQDFQFRLALQPDYRHKIVFTGISNRDRADLTDGPGLGSIKNLSVKDITFNDVAGIQWTWTHSPQVIGRYDVSFYQNGGSNAFQGVQNTATSFGLDLSTQEFQHLQDSLIQAGVNVPDLLRSAGTYNFLFRKFSLKGGITWAADDIHTLEAGVSMDEILTDIDIGVKLDPRSIAIRSTNFRYATLPASFSTSLQSLRLGAYLQDNYRLTEKWSLAPGVRCDYFGINRRLAVAPRFSVSYTFFPGTLLRLGWGIYYQSPGYEKSFLPGYETYISSTTYDLSGGNAAALRNERAVTASLSWETMLTAEWQLRIGAYHKALSNLIYPAIVRGTTYRSTRVEENNILSPDGWSPPAATPDDSLTTRPENSGSGSAEGGEIILQKIFSPAGAPLYGWISYAYCVANRERNGWTYPFDFDRRHSVNVVLGWKAASWLDLNLTFSYGSGYPSTPPVGFTPRIYTTRDSLTNAAVPHIDSDWQGVVFTVNRGGLHNINSGRLPDYHRLDLRATTSTSWFGWNWSLYIDVMNVYNRKNVALEEYYVDRETLAIRTIQTLMIPFLPSIGATIVF